MDERTVADVLSGDVERIRIVYDAKGEGAARAHATVQLAGEAENIRFEGDDVTRVADHIAGLRLDSGE